jgi:hypothetical protein
MNGSDRNSLRAPRGLNAVPLQNAVLCVECDVVSDSPHDACMVCGSHSLFSIARVFGGKLPKERASLLGQKAVEVSSRDFVVIFPTPGKVRKKAAARPRRFTVGALDDKETDKLGRGMLVQPKGP